MALVTTGDSVWVEDLDDDPTPAVLVGYQQDRPTVAIIRLERSGRQCKVSTASIRRRSTTPNTSTASLTALDGQPSIVLSTLTSHTNDETPDVADILQHPGLPEVVLAAESHLATGGTIMRAGTMTLVLPAASQKYHPIGPAVGAPFAATPSATSSSSGFGASSSSSTTAFGGAASSSSGFGGGTSSSGVSQDSMGRVPRYGSIARAVLGAGAFAQQDQVVLAHGRPGTGKTMALQHVLLQVAQEAGATLGDVGKVQQALHLLNALTSASTAPSPTATPHPASTRACLRLRLHMGPSSRPRGFTAAVDLLETSRLATLRPGHRTFNVFHHLVAGAPQEFRRSLRLYSHTYPLLSRSPPAPNAPADAPAFTALTAALDALAIPADLQRHFWGCLAALTLLSSVTFSEQRGKGASPSSGSAIALASAAELLGLEEPAMWGLLSDVSVSAAKRKRDTVVSDLYTEVVRWAVDQVNEALGPDAPGVWGVEKRAEGEGGGKGGGAKKRAGGWAIVEENSAEGEGDGGEEKRERKGWLVELVDVGGVQEQQEGAGLDQLLLAYVADANAEAAVADCYCTPRNNGRAEELAVPPAQRTDYTRELVEFLEGVDTGVLPLLVEYSTGSGSSATLRELIKQHPARRYVAELPTYPEDALIVRHCTGKVEYELGACLRDNQCPVPKDMIQTLRTSTNPMVATAAATIDAHLVIDQVAMAISAARGAPPRIRPPRAQSALTLIDEIRATGRGTALVPDSLVAPASHHLLCLPSPSAPDQACLKLLKAYSVEQAAQISACALAVRLPTELCKDRWDKLQADKVAAEQPDPPAGGLEEISEISSSTSPFAFYSSHVHSFSASADAMEATRKLLSHARIPAHCYHLRGPQVYLTASAAITLNALWLAAAPSAIPSLASYDRSVVAVARRCSSRVPSTPTPLPDHLAQWSGPPPQATGGGGAAAVQMPSPFAPRAGPTTPTASAGGAAALRSPPPAGGGDAAAAAAAVGGRGEAPVAAGEGTRGGAAPEEDAAAGAPASTAMGPASGVSTATVAAGTAAAAAAVATAAGVEDRAREAEPPGSRGWAAAVEGGGAVGGQQQGAPVLRLSTSKLVEADILPRGASFSGTSDGTSSSGTAATAAAASPVAVAAVAAAAGAVIGSGGGTSDTRETKSFSHASAAATPLLPAPSHRRTRSDSTTLLDAPFTFGPAPAHPPSIPSSDPSSSSSSDSDSDSSSDGGAHAPARPPPTYARCLSTSTNPDHVSHLPSITEESEISITTTLFNPFTDSSDCDDEAAPPANSTPTPAPPAPAPTRGPRSLPSSTAPPPPAAPPPPSRALSHPPFTLSSHPIPSNSLATTSLPDPAPPATAPPPMLPPTAISTGPPSRPPPEAAFQDPPLPVPSESPTSPTPLVPSPYLNHDMQSKPSLLAAFAAHQASPPPPAPPQPAPQSSRQSYPPSTTTSRPLQFPSISPLRESLPNLPMSAPSTPPAPYAYAASAAAAFLPVAARPFPPTPPQVWASTEALNYGHASEEIQPCSPLPSAGHLGAPPSPRPSRLHAPPAHHVPDFSQPARPHDLLGPPPATPAPLSAAHLHPHPNPNPNPQVPPSLTPYQMQHAAAPHQRPTTAPPPSSQPAHNPPASAAPPARPSTAAPTTSANGQPPQPQQLPAALPAPAVSAATPAPPQPNLAPPSQAPAPPPSKNQAFAERIDNLMVELAEAHHLMDLELKQISDVAEGIRGAPPGVTPSRLLSDFLEDYKQRTADTKGKLKAFRKELGAAKKELGSSHGSLVADLGRVEGAHKQWKDAFKARLGQAQKHVAEFERGTRPPATSRYMNLATSLLPHHRRRASS